MRFWLSKTLLRCLRAMVVSLKCPKRVREVPMKRYGRLCGDIVRAINRMRTAHGSIELHGTFYFPCAMALRLMPCSPRRRIRLVTVVGGSRLIKLGRVDAASAQLGTSNGCQDHTVLPYASAPFVLRGRARSRKTALRTLPARDAVASTTSRTNVRDDRDTPLLWARDGGHFSFDLPDGLSGIFFCEGLDRLLD